MDNYVDHLLILDETGLSLKLLSKAADKASKDLDKKREENKASHYENKAIKNQFDKRLKQTQKFTNAAYDKMTNGTPILRHAANKAIDRINNGRSAIAKATNKPSFTKILPSFGDPGRLVKLNK